MGHLGHIEKGILTPERINSPRKVFSPRKILSPKRLFSPKRKSKEKKGYDVTQRQGMLNQTLSARRELVELLDSEPLFDYLLQNGALKPAVVEEIKEEKTQVQANLALLRCIEGNGKTAQNLFINALRQTGQHYLANHIDEGVRIKALSGSGYLSKGRHRGQVTLQILVEAFKLIPESLTSLGVSLSREWLSLEDIQISIATLRKPRKSVPSIPSVPIAETFEIKEPENESRQSCGFCGCFSKLFSRKKSSKKYQASNNKKNSVQYTNGTEPPEKPNNTPLNNEDVMNESVISNRNGELLNESVLSNGARTSVENLRNVAHTIQEMSEEFYQQFVDSSGTPRTQLLKYFEQMRGVLVLDSSYVDGIALVCICTKPDQLEEIVRDFDSGKLTEDVEEAVVTADMKESLGVTGIRLRVDINREEFESAEQELAY